MPHATTWDEVWAEYDARAARPAPQRAPRATPLPKPAQPGRRRRLGAALALVLLALAGVAMGQAGWSTLATAHSVAATQERSDLVVIGLAGQDDFAESPAEPPPPVYAELAGAAESSIAALPPTRAGRAMAATRRPPGEGRAQAARQRPRGQDVAATGRAGVGRQGGAPRVETRWAGTG
jgi:hypothetical protein